MHEIDINKEVVFGNIFLVLYEYTISEKTIFVDKEIMFYSQITVGK